MADNSWLSAYTPIDTQAAPAPPQEEDHSWLKAYTPVDAPQNPTPQPQSAVAPSKADPEVSGPQALQSGFEDMLLFGGKDEAFAGLDAAAQPLFGTGNDGESFSDRYDKNLIDQRAFNKASQDQHPILNTVGGVAGAVAPMLLTGGLSTAGTAAAGAKATLASTAAKSAAIGAAQGGAYGFGSADGDLGDRAASAGTGAALGGVLGAALPLAVSGVSSLARKATPDRLLTGPAARAEAAVEDAAPAGPAQPADVTVNSSGQASTAPGPAVAAAEQLAEPTEASIKTAAAAVGDAASASAKGSEVAQGELAAVIQPQRGVLDAASRLGVDGLTPGQYSGSQSYRNLEGALSAIPGNELDAQKRASFSQLSQKADDFINDFGGNTDKAAFSDDFKRNVTSTISGLNTQADDLYKYIGAQIPNTTEAPANNTIAYIQGRIADLGGAPLLNPDQRKALAILSPKTFVEPAGALFPGQIVNRTQYPTYAALDLVRKQVGQGYSRAGPFKDMQSGQLDALYSTLTKDQEALVNSVSPELGAIYKGAKSVVAQRKDLEDGLKSVLGNELSGSIATSLGSSVKQLSQGNFKNFDNIIKHIPEQDRQSAIVTALNDAFTNKSSSEHALSASGFVSWYGDLARNNSARARLTKYLPDEAVKRLDDIYTVAKAMSQASGVTRHTGVALGALKDYAAEGGMLSRLMGVAKPALLAEAAGHAVGVPGLGTASVLISAFKKNPPPIQERAFELLASPQFQNVVKSYANSGGQLRANVLAREKQLVRTMAYRKWESALSDSARARVATVGPLVYLTEKEVEPAKR